MRRLALLAVALLFLSPSALRLAAVGSSPDAAAILCAIACGHEVTGAVCCPMRPERPAGPSFQSCSGTGPAGVVSPPGAQPGLLPARLALSGPVGGPRSENAPDASPRILPLPTPDHVPLLLS